MTLTRALRASHGLEVRSLRRVMAGVTTENYVAATGGGAMFVKVYPAGADLAAEDQAIRLGEFVAAAGVPTATLIPGRTGDRIAIGAGLAYSVWRFIDLPSGQVHGLNHEQMTHLGTVLGRLHQRLAHHPMSLAAPGARVPAPDLTHVPGQLAELADTVHRDDPDPFRRWARQALQERAAILPRLTAATSFPAQVIHGDLASPNVLLSEHAVAAVIDFSPPRIGAIAHDISRVGCDPRTVLRLGRAWPAAFAALAAAYRRHNPAISAADVVGAVRWWLRHTAASLYPLRTLLNDGPATDTDLVRYARQRHVALRMVLDLADHIGRPESEQAPEVGNGAEPLGVRRGEG